MNETKLGKILEMYLENEEMKDYFSGEEKKPERDRYNTANYTIQRTLEIMLECETVYIMVTQTYKRKDTVTVVKVYKDDITDETLYATYYPAFEKLTIEKSAK